MKITIFGATGMVGKVLTDAALEAGHEVTALVRSPDKLGPLAKRIRVIDGEYFSTEAQGEALSDAEAVMTTVGPRMKRGPNQGEYAKGMQALVNAMEAASVRRIVAIGGAGLKLGEEKLSFRRAVMRQILTAIAGASYKDKEREHNLLAASELDWTIVRPPQIAPAKGALTPTLDQAAGMKVDTRQLAGFMLACLDDPSTIRTAPFVATI
ncbi:MAG: NAD(P)H-binding protein [Pseudomonadota bacterium]